MARNHEVPIRIYAMLVCPLPSMDQCVVDLPSPLKHKQSFQNVLTVKSVKLFLDGALGSWGAAMKQVNNDQIFIF
jgi:predicted amidohydrolase YtcJ